MSTPIESFEAEMKRPASKIFITAVMERNIEISELERQLELMRADEFRFFGEKVKSLFNGDEVFRQRQIRDLKNKIAFLKDPQRDADDAAKRDAANKVEEETEAVEADKQKVLDEKHELIVRAYAERVKFAQYWDDVFDR
jgi:hypothetical protein